MIYCFGGFELLLVHYDASESSRKVTPAEAQPVHIAEKDSRDGIRSTQTGYGLGDTPGLTPSKRLDSQ
jgi:hypothetical protein